MLCLMVYSSGSRLYSRCRSISFPRSTCPWWWWLKSYNGMPPQQVEADITDTFERFFTLAANVDHSESRSLTGVSLIKIYFKPGTNPE